MHFPTRGDRCLLYHQGRQAEQRQHLRRIAGAGRCQNWAPEATRVSGEVDSHKTGGDCCGDPALP